MTELQDWHSFARMKQWMDSRDRYNQGVSFWINVASDNSGKPLQEVCMTHSDRNTTSPSDPRTQVTYVIWGLATAMFAICIPLSALTRGSAIIPAAVAVGAGAGTVAVWRSGSHSRRQLKSEAMVRSLEERIANLEAIASHGEFDTQKRFQQLELQNRQE